MTVAHDTFTVKRRYPVPRDRVFVAWADPTVKIRWFTGSSTATTGASSSSAAPRPRPGTRPTAPGSTTKGSTGTSCPASGSS